MTPMPPAASHQHRPMSPTTALPRFTTLPPVIPLPRPPHHPLSRFAATAAPATTYSFFPSCAPTPAPPVHPLPAALPPSPQQLHSRGSPPLPPAILARPPPVARTGSSASSSAAGADQSHIHPLFRTESPGPPPVRSPGTIITASSYAGQVLTPPELAALGLGGVGSGSRAGSPGGSRAGSPSGGRWRREERPGSGKA